MIVINREAVRQMMRDHSDAVAALDEWWRVVKAARWSHLEACRRSIASADQMGRCLIFTIAGSNCRLINVVSWRNQRLFVKALLTHR